MSKLAHEGVDLLQQVSTHDQQRWGIGSAGQPYDEAWDTLGFAKQESKCHSEAPASPAHVTLKVLMTDGPGPADGCKSWTPLGQLSTLPSNMKMHRPRAKGGSLKKGPGAIPGFLVGMSLNDIPRAGNFLPAPRRPSLHRSCRGYTKTGSHAKAILIVKPTGQASCTLTWGWFFRELTFYTTSKEAKNIHCLPGMWVVIGPGSVSTRFAFPCQSEDTHLGQGTTSHVRRSCVFSRCRNAVQTLRVHSSSQSCHVGNCLCRTCAFSRVLTSANHSSNIGLHRRIIRMHDP